MNHLTVNLNTLVIKIGGTSGLDYSAICKDISNLKDDKTKIVIVHGGSEKANELGESVGYPPRFVTSPSGYTSRYTDKKTMDIFIMAVNGSVNTALVSELQSRNVNAIGLSGVDGKLISGKRKAAIRIIENGKRKILRDDFTGTIKRVNVKLLNHLIAEGFVPVIAPLAISENAEPLNVDADRAAAKVAAAINADLLLLLTAAPGLLRDFSDNGSLIKTMKAAQLDDAFQFAQGRMKKKVLGAKEALEDGVGCVIITDGRVENPVSAALNGAGTRIQ